MVPRWVMCRRGRGSMLAGHSSAFQKETCEVHEQPHPSRTPRLVHRGRRRRTRPSPRPRLAEHAHRAVRTRARRGGWRRGGDPGHPGGTIHVCYDPGDARGDESGAKLGIIDKARNPRGCDSEDVELTLYRKGPKGDPGTNGTNGTNGNERQERRQRLRVHREGPQRRPPADRRRLRGSLPGGQGAARRRRDRAALQCEQLRPPRQRAAVLAAGRHVRQRQRELVCLDQGAREAPATHRTNER